MLNQSIRLDPGRFIKNKKNILNKLFLLSKYRIDQKNENGEDGALFNFIQFDFNDPSLVSYNSSVDHSLFINRGQTEWDIQFSYRRINNKIVQITGFEQREQQEYFSRLRYNLHRQLDFLTEIKTGSVRRNFYIHKWSFSPQLNYRPDARFRAIAKISLEQKENKASSEVEKAAIINSGLEISWRHQSTSNLELEFNYVNINYEEVKIQLHNLKCYRGSEMAIISLHP